MARTQPPRSVAVARSILRRGLSRLGIVRPVPPCVPLATLVGAYGPRGPAPEVLFLGDSVSVRVSRDDRDPSPLTAMLARELPAPLRTCAVAQDGYHAGVFLSLARLLSTLPQKPKVIVASLNVRSCSPQWALNPLWQYTETLRAIESYTAHPASGIPRLAEPPPSEEQQNAFLTAPVDYPDRPETTVADFVAAIGQSPLTEEEQIERRRTIFTFHYGFALSEDNPRLPQLRMFGEQIAALGREGVRAVLYVTPVNYQAGERLLGSDFGETLRQRAATILQACAPSADGGGHVTVRDWSMLLPASSFFHEFEPTEHLNQHGRQALALRIVEDTVNALGR